MPCHLCIPETKHKAEVIYLNQQRFPDGSLFVDVWRSREMLSNIACLYDKTPASNEVIKEQENCVLKEIFV
uniref:Uncharacterized protein n=1 Tax=Rhizophora mucronata TaxID=61149 RepID=A0A2P2P039_RHIMU